MQIDWSSNLVGIAQIIVFVVGGLGVLFGVIYNVKSLKTDVRGLKKDVKALTTAISTVAVIETKTEGVKDRLEDEKQTGREFRDWVRAEIGSIWRAISRLGEKADPIALAARKTVTPL